MKTLILTSVLHNNELVDICIENGSFVQIASHITPTADADVIDCSGLAIVPPFYNAHTHAAMTIFRGLADDLPLQTWLQDYIWKAEAQLTAKDVEIGARLAALEMIKSGTVFFSDMYFFRDVTMKVALEMGLRESVGIIFSDMLMSDEAMDENLRFIRNHCHDSDMRQLSIMPHAIYTTSEKVFKRCVDIAKAEGLILHTHLSETKKEFDDCMKEHGCTPVELMERYGTLSDSFVAAHCVHLTDRDIQILKEYNCTVALNICSNLKLASGIPQVCKLLDAGVSLAMGTDGAASNNNLDMHEEMKITALLAKVENMNAEDLSAKTALNIATEGGARAYKLHGGVIAEGRPADALLIDLNNERMTPRHNIISNWVYAADARTIHSVICNGRFIMRNHHVDGEEDIIKEAQGLSKRYGLA